LTFIFVDIYSPYFILGGFVSMKLSEAKKRLRKAKFIYVVFQMAIEEVGGKMCGETFKDMMRGSYVSGIFPGHGEIRLYSFASKYFRGTGNELRFRIHGNTCDLESVKKFGMAMEGWTVNGIKCTSNY